MRCAAIEVLAGISERQAIEPLIAALEDPDASVRQAAARSLASFSRSRALDERARLRILSHKERAEAELHTDHTVALRSSDCTGSQHVDQGSGLWP